jgi:phosphocarrier protein
MSREPSNARAVPQARSRALLTHGGGLHARPAIRLTQLAKRFESAVWIALAETGPWVDAKSIARVMRMKIPSMAMLHFAAEGEDADVAVRALAALVNADFAGADDAR